MPATSINQLKYFKLIKAYKEGGIKSFFQKWREVYGVRPFPNTDYIEKIKEKSLKIKDADLEDLTSGLKGDNNIGDIREFKAGYFALFKGAYRDPITKEIKTDEFIGKIKSVRRSPDIVNFRTDELYNRFGTRISPLHRAVIADPQFQYLDYAYFKDVIKTGKTINDVSKNRIIKEIVKVINDVFSS